jgi:hypothetical protein
MMRRFSAACTPPARISSARVASERGGKRSRGPPIKCIPNIPHACILIHRPTTLGHVKVLVADTLHLYLERQTVAFRNNKFMASQGIGGRGLVAAWGVRFR